ncbi:hypothetical protein [Sinorhizobium arboris]|uniref:hypothetical protein n=1 Tax=Sinorhizobium arboris TaxID=76745 RepID=UPI0004872AEE|nr:hypothetical protein [Sinorhizobium arboris]
MRARRPRLSPTAVSSLRYHREVGESDAVERFFADATERLKNAEHNRRQRLEERLALARAVMESADLLASIESWVALEERHRSKFL